MQRRQHEEEEEKGKRVWKREQERGLVKGKEKQKKRRGKGKGKGRVESGMWGSWSRVRCIPQPSAVCSSIRTSIAHPIAQVGVCRCVFNLVSLLCLWLALSVCVI